MVFIPSSTQLAKSFDPNGTKKYAIHSSNNDKDLSQQAKDELNKAKNKLDTEWEAAKYKTDAELNNAKEKLDSYKNEAKKDLDKYKDEAGNDLSKYTNDANIEWNKTKGRFEHYKDKAMFELDNAQEKLLGKQVVSATATANADGIQLFSPQYYLACGFGGAFACSTTHAAITPLDLVKCRRQVDSSLYKSNIQGWKAIMKGEGAGALFTGFGATFIGYGFQGAGKYGLYEVFKKKYSDILGDQIASNYKTSVFLAASASAEFFADIFLCPWEAIKLKMQTTLPPYATTLPKGFSKFLADEGVKGMYKGIGPLWARQIPYTMVKFATFENIVAATYKALPYEKEEMSKVGQTGVSFFSGYIAGLFCATVSHPADVLTSLVNADRGANESMMQATRRHYAKIGFNGLWNGLPVRLVMIGTLTGAQWLLYDSFKVYMGLPTTGSH